MECRTVDKITFQFKEWINSLRNFPICRKYVPQRKGNIDIYTENHSLSPLYAKRVIQPFKNHTNTISINEKFGMNSIRYKWPMFSMQYVGKTTMSHDAIKQEGIFIYIFPTPMIFPPR